MSTAAPWSSPLIEKPKNKIVYIGKHRLNEPSVFMGKLSRSTFAVYIFHPLVFIFLALAVRNLAIEPLKLLLVAPLAVALSFMLGLLILQIPGVRRII